MNILFIAYNFTPSTGGVQRVTDILTKELKRRGHNVSFLCACNDITGNIDLSTDIYYMDKSVSEKFGDGSIKLYKELLMHLNIDVIINQYPIRIKSNFFLKHAFSSITKLSVYHTKPLVQFDYKLKQYKNSYKNLFNCLKYLYLKNQTRRQLIKIIQYSDRLIVLSESYKKQLSTILNFDPYKIVAINNPNTFSKQDSEISKQDEVIFVGRINDEVKNIEGFIKVWESVSSFNDKWSAHIYGNDMDSQNIKEYVVKNKISRIYFEGKKRNMIDAYSRAKIICITSHYEGWPMVLTEALTQGCIPIVFETFEACHDIITDGENGFICIPYNYGQMSDKIRLLMDDSTLMHKMSLNAINSVSKFMPDAIVDQWESLIFSLRK